VVIALAGALLFGGPLLLRAFVMEAFQNPSGSMMPALYVGDHFFVSKRPHRPQRGEVVVFRYPPDPSVDYVKRVAALAGDTIEITDGLLIVQGKDLSRREETRTCADVLASAPETPDGPCEVWSETALGGGRYDIVQGTRHAAFGPFTVPDGTAFVLGDNRDNSSDSRVWGPVPLSLVKGSAMFVWWSGSPGGVRWPRLFHWIR